MKNSDYLAASSVLVLPDDPKRIERLRNKLEKYKEGVRSATRFSVRVEFAYVSQLLHLLLKGLQPLAAVIVHDYVMYDKAESVRKCGSNSFRVHQELCQMAITQVASTIKMV